MGRHRGGGGYPQPQESTADAKKTLERFATETGGQFFEVTKKLPMDQALAEVQEDIRNQYALNFTPTPAADSGAYHKLQLTGKKKDLVVQARDGYYAEANH